MILRLLPIVAVLCTSMGCIAYTATPSVQGTAYVTTNDPFTGSMYYCDARRERPACWRVEELGVEESQ